MKHTRKIVSLLLGLVMLFSMNTAAFAAEYEDVNTVTVSKTYRLTNDGTTSPAETFRFSALTCTNVENAGVGVTTGNAPIPTIGDIAYTEGEAGSDTATKTVEISLPAYDAVGVYTYSFTEQDGGTAGVTYRTDAMRLVVTVVQGDDGKIRVAAVHTESEEDGDKSDAFDNVYSAGSLAVKKTVSGNLGDQDKEFHATVTFSAPEGDTVRGTISYVDGGDSKTIAPTAWADGSVSTEITLKHDETVTFTNIPYGVSYTVVETEANQDGYTTSYTGENGTMNAASQNTTITNTKGMEVDTGIYTDNLPYILLLGVVAVGVVVYVVRRRGVRE